MTKQELRNAISGVENEAGELRDLIDSEPGKTVFRLISELAQLVREEIVK